MTQAIILDFDGSVQGIDAADIIPLRDRQEHVRFGCSRKTLHSLRPEIARAVPDPRSVVFLGSGDYHHVTLLLIERLCERSTPIQVVVFDNHPDNMRYPFGIHCGSWVAHVSSLPFVSRVHVVGIASSDVEGLHVLENRIAPLRHGKVVYWCVGRDLQWLRILGVRASRSFDSTAAMLAEFATAISASAQPVYISIDKDVLGPDVVRTNWDQGVMRLEELTAAIGLLSGRIVGADVTGDVSAYRYRGWFKRLLSRLDAQPEVDGPQLAEWQREHGAINRELLAVLMRGFL